jgi:hypothetical protein
MVKRKSVVGCTWSGVNKELSQGVVNSTERAIGSSSSDCRQYFDAIVCAKGRVLIAAMQLLVIQKEPVGLADRPGSIVEHWRKSRKFFA